MGRASLDHKIEQKYTNTTYTGSNMRRMTPNTALSGLTISHLATALTTVGALTSTNGQSGETFTYVLTDPSGKFQLSANVVQNIAANPPIGTYPVSVKTNGSLGSMSTTSFTITST